MIVAGFGPMAVLGLTKSDVELLTKSEVLLLPEFALVLVYAEDSATLEAAVRLAAEMATGGDSTTAKPLADA